MNDLMNQKIDDALVESEERSRESVRRSIERYKAIASVESDYERKSRLDGIIRCAANAKSAAGEFEEKYREMKRKIESGELDYSSDEVVRTLALHPTMHILEVGNQLMDDMEDDQ